MANYDFDWDSALQVSLSKMIRFPWPHTSINIYFNYGQFVLLQLVGDSGNTLHLNHSRLCNLQTVTGIQEAETCRPEYLAEPEAKALIYCIARYPDVVLRSKDSQDPCGLVKYCFELWCVAQTESYVQNAV